MVLTYGFLKKIKELIIIKIDAAIITAILELRNSAIIPRNKAPADNKLNVIVCIPITLPRKFSGTFKCKRDIEHTMKIELKAPMKKINIKEKTRL